MSIPIRRFYHDSSLFSLPHVLNRSPESVWHCRGAKGHLKWLLLVEEHFAFDDLIITVDLSIRANARSSRAFGQMTIMVVCFALAHFAVLPDDIDLNPSDILVEN